MDPNRFTEKMQEALHAAQSLAVRNGNPQIDVEDLLYALLSPYADARNRENFVTLGRIAGPTR